MAAIPVIDIFAGPGGLSEGFAALKDKRGNRCFDVRLSIEKDRTAHRTLELRAFFRSFSRPPDSYYDYLRGRLDHAALFADRRFSDNVATAGKEAWCHTLSESTHELVAERVRKALQKASTWVLIGGPPCQAYSLVGRSRMKSSAPRLFEKDERHFLYKEYLRIIAEHEPPIFVMENVKGLLSSTVGGDLIFNQIVRDLSRPNGGSLRYRIVPLTDAGESFNYKPHDFLIRSEKFGIPQARHRVLLCGIREDLTGRPSFLRPAGMDAHIEDAISDLPAIRSRISRRPDDPDEWLATLKTAATLAKRKFGRSLEDVADAMERFAILAARIKDIGAPFVRKNKVARHDKPAARVLSDWYSDDRLCGVTGHESRSHMASDLHRYLFAASFAAVRPASPKLSDFPKALLPNHANASKSGAPFEDRFRVQKYGRPATTVVSHISKDGHYFIHPDPSQCRSLTVREAARLQTFPDNYHFEGNRTQQFVQVGNAVPPLLAYRIADAITGFLLPRQPSVSTRSDAESRRELERI